MNGLFTKLLRAGGLLAFFAFAFFLFSWYGVSENTGARYGVTFSPVMARQLGMSPAETFDAIVDDLEIRLIRLPIYWSDIEKINGVFDFSEYDRFFRKAEERGVSLIPVVGRKLPRWPECHIPQWAETLGPEEFRARVANQILAVVMRYASSSAVIRWQVENEPFHVYGSGCAEGKISGRDIDEEISLVRALDSRPIMLTDSGEQGIWVTSLSRAEYLGISTYYQVWNDTLGIVRFPFGPGFYWLKGAIARLVYPERTIVVSELQAEPWGPSLLPDYDLSLQLRLVNEKRFREIIRRARLAGFSENILWGVEWWYWLKKTHNRPELWEEAKKVL